MIYLLSMYLQIGDIMSPECRQHFFEKGVSQTKGHLEKRNSCLKEFEIAYGYMPLLESRYQAINPWCIPGHYFYNYIMALLFSK